MRTFCFRVDGSASIGGGHLSRCLTLAEALVGQGHAVHFFSAGEQGFVRPRVEAAGYELTMLDCAVRSSTDDLEAPLDDDASAADAAASCDAMSAHGTVAGKTRTVIVDHYGLDHRWESALAEISDGIVVLDDLANRRHACDVLVDAAPRREEDYRALVGTQTQLLLGPRFALLRKEFRERQGVGPRTSVERVLVSFGAIDPAGHALMAIRAIRRSLGPEIRVECPIASASPQLGNLQALAAQDGNLVLHVDSTRMAELISRADVAIGAGGLTGWERAALGLPSIMFVLAKNQRPTARAIAEGGAGLLLEGDASEEDLGSVLKLLASQPIMLSRMSEAGAALCDARGAARIARAAAPAQIVCRAATEDDGRFIWAWRNDPAVRKTALDPAEIPWEGHRKWFASRLGDERGALLVAEEHGVARGVVRYDVSGSDPAEAMVSIYLDPASRGRGIGPAVLAAGELWLKDNRPPITRLLATVKHDNGPSRKLFEGADYRPFSILHRKEIAP